MIHVTQRLLNDLDDRFERRWYEHLLGEGAVWYSEEIHACSPVHLAELLDSWESIDARKVPSFLVNGRGDLEEELLSRVLKESDLVRRDYKNERNFDKVWTKHKQCYGF